eukprot:jgi/Ulvmu1/7207/UM034_0116.1
MRLSGPNTELLQCGRWSQRARTGGPEATEPPPMEANRVVKLKPAAINQEAIEDPAFYPQPAFMLDISFSPPAPAGAPSAPATQAPATAPADTHPSAAPHPASEQTSVTYVLDAGNAQRLQQPGFYPSPFAPSTDMDNGSTTVTISAPVAPDAVLPAYHSTGPATVSDSSPGGGVAYGHALNTPAGPVPAAPPAPHPYPMPGVVANGHAHGPHLHYPAPAVLGVDPTAAYATPSAPRIHTSLAYAADHTAPPPYAPAVEPSAPSPPPYPSPVAYDAHPAPAYPDLHAPSPQQAAVLPTYHTDQKPSV